jgi:hypothetical protein
VEKPHRTRPGPPGLLDHPLPMPRGAHQGQAGQAPPGGQSGQKDRWTERATLFSIGVSHRDQLANGETPEKATVRKPGVSTSLICVRHRYSDGVSDATCEVAGGGGLAGPVGSTPEPRRHAHFAIPDQPSEVEGDDTATDPPGGLEPRGLGASPVNLCSEGREVQSCPSLAGSGEPCRPPGRPYGGGPALTDADPLGVLQGAPRPPAGPWAAPATSGPRWCGNLGPSLFMTAVERQSTADRGRAELERLGAQVRRIAGWSAEQRARNDLPPREELSTALWAPSGRFADLLREGLREGIEKGDALTRAHAAAHAAGLGPDGLDPRPTSAQPTREQGWRGLTTPGRRAIRDAGAVMDEHRGTLGFWTVTLPPAAAEVATREHIATFQSRLLFFARRAMVRAGLPPLALLVAELHPGRRTMGGDRIPHWHLIVKVSREPFRPWAIPVSGWHRIVDAAHRAAFGVRRGGTWGCKMLPGRTGAARYLAPYMAKDRSDVSVLHGTRAGRMVPRQWWSWTGELREAVKACRLRPPSAFLRWCCRWWRELVDLGDVTRSDVIQIGDDGPVVGRWFVWASESALDQAIETWIGEEIACLDAKGPARPW